MSNIGIVGLTQVFTVGISQIVVIFLARILTPEDFGLYSLCAVMISLSTYVSTFGLDAAVIHRQDDFEACISTASVARLVLSVVAMVIVFGTSNIISEVVGFPELASPLRVISIGIPLSAMGFESIVWLSKNLRFPSLSMARFVYAIAWGICALVLAVAGFGYWSLIYSYVIGMTLMVIALWIIRPWNIRVRVNIKILGELMKYGGFVVGTGMIGFLVWNIDKIVIGSLLTSASLLGAYFIAFTYGTYLPKMLTNATMEVMFPTLSRIRDDLKELRDKFLLTLKYSGYVSIPIGFGLATIAPTFISVLLGSKWTDSIVPLSILSLVGVLSALTSPASSVFLATGNANKMFRQTLATSVPYFILLAPMTVFCGIVGVCLLFLAISIISFVWVISLTSRIIGCGFRDEIRPLYEPALSATLMSISCGVIQNCLEPSPIVLAFEVITGAAIYGTCMILLTKGQFIVELRNIMNSILRSRKE